MDQQTLTLKIKGRYTHPNDLSEVPDGALTVAKNVNIDEESIATPRRGFDRQGYGLSSGSSRFKQIFKYQDTMLAAYDTNKLARDTGSAWTDYSGTYDPPDSDTPIRSIEASENFYFMASDGMYRLDSPTGTPVKAGVPKGLTVELALTGTSGFLSNSGDTRVAYRVVWGFKDENKNLILGAPSERANIINTAGAGRNVNVTVTIPDGITTDHFVQVYRSAAVTSSTEPSDEMQLTLEVFPSSSEITAKSMTILDNRIEEILGATIYTAPSQQTISQANETPPLAKDMAVFKNHVFFLNTQSKHRLFLTILAADGGASPGTALQVDDVITINGVAYTGKASTTVASDQFAVSTSSSPATAIRDTALELIKVINQTSSNSGSDAIYAFYVSGVDDTPGQILLESRSVGGAQFAVTYTPNSHSGNPFQPVLPSSGTGVSSANDNFKNALAFSKLGQPEAVPLVNLFRVGSADEAGLRIVPLRDSLFILKEDGVYRLTGESAANFRVELFDDTARIRAPQTAVTLNNALFFFSDQGVVQATETGISVISRPIEIDLLELIGDAGLSAIKKYAFAVGYETERKYILGVPQTSSEESATYFHVYNTFTNAWTTWQDLDAKDGFIFDDDDKLYLADTGSNFMLEERKAFSSFDHGDFVTATTISDVTDTTVTLSNTSEMSSGDVIYQSNTSFAIIESVDTTAGTVETYFDGALTAAAATVYQAIDTEVSWVPFHGGNPSLLKQFSEVAFMFKQSFAVQAEVGFASDQSESVRNLTITGRSFGNWGFFSWGSVPWGGLIKRFPFRTWVPRQKQKCTQLTVSFKHKIAFSEFKLSGFSAFFRFISTRFSR